MGFNIDSYVEASVFVGAIGKCSLNLVGFQVNKNPGCFVNNDGLGNVNSCLGYFFGGKSFDVCEGLERCFTIGYLKNMGFTGFFVYH